MAQRRMFSPHIVQSDKFLDMPVSAQNLYFHLGLNADDDGFVTPKKIMRMVGSSEDDLKILIAKNFVIPFESGVIVITHWKINNLVRKDWYRETEYLEEKSLLETESNGTYKLVNEPLTKRQPNVNVGRLGRLGRLGRKVGSNEENKFSKETELNRIKQQLKEKYRFNLN